MIKRDGERIDDLNRDGLRIIQSENQFCFGMDAVLLSDFAKAQEGDLVVDLGTGTGIVPILMSSKTKAKHFTAVEVQKEMVDMARRSVLLNQLDERISIIEGDIKEASTVLKRAAYDVVTTNPPYMNDSHGLKNPNPQKAIARHEVLCSLEDVIREATYLLKPGGHFFMVHRPFRLAEIIVLMRNYKLEPKRVQMVHPFIDKEANMLLIEGVRGGKSMMKVEPPLVVYEKGGEFSGAIHRIYEG